MWWLRRDKQTCLGPFTRRHSVSRVEETHRLCTLVTLKADCNPDDSMPLRSWAVGFVFFPALRRQTKSAWNATWVPESNEPWHSSQKHLLFTTSKSLACALQTNFNWSPSVQLNNEPEERDSTLRNKGRSIPLGSCPPPVITAAGQGQKKWRRRNTLNPMQDTMMKPWQIKSFSYSRLGKSPRHGIWAPLWVGGNQWISWLNGVHFSNPIPV